MRTITIESIESATDDELALIIEKTEYTENSVVIGEDAKDQDLRRAAQKELDRRAGRENE